LSFCAATLYVGRDLWPALVLAAWTAGLTRPLLERIERVLKGRRRAAAALSLLLFLVLLVPLSLLVLGVGAGVQDLAQAASRANSAKGALEDLAAGGAAPAGVLHMPGNIEQAADLLQRYGSQAYGVAARIAGAALGGMAELFIYFAGAVALLVDGDPAWKWVRRNAPLTPAHLDRFAAAFHEIGRGLLVA
jgi:predicted PurR-regulated permease PerM